MKEKALSLLGRIIMILFALTILFPIFWIVVKSLQTNREFFAGAWSLPEVLQWGNYAKAWEGLGIGESLLNTVVYVVLSLVFSLALTCAAAYVLTRLQFKGRKLLVGIIMLSLFLPEVNVLVPTYVLMRSMKLLNSVLGLVLVNTLKGDAFSLLVLRGFMQTIPKDFEESAFLDGASLPQAFYKIVIPMAMPGVITLATFKTLWYYNDFILPYIVLQDPLKYTIGVKMFSANQLMQQRADWVTLCAAIVITMIPPIVLFIAFQKKIIEGATLGGLKG